MLLWERLVRWCKVRVLLQNVVTLSFVGCDSGWTVKTGEALDFVEVVHAVDYALSQGLHDVRVVLKFEDSRFDLPLPSVRGAE